MLALSALPGQDSVACQFDHPRRQRALRQIGLAGYRLGGVAIAVARGEIHRAIDAGRVAKQGLFDDALGFDEFLPVHRADDAQAADAVADRYLIGRLQLILGLHHLGNGQARFGQMLLDPGQRQGQRRAAALQATDQLGNKGADHGRL